MLTRLFKHTLKQKYRKLLGRQFECKYIYRISAKFDENLSDKFSEILKDKTSTDLIHIYMTSNGGQVCEAFEIRNLLNKCPAYVIYHVTKNVDSAATLLLDVVDLVIVENKANLMYHNMKIKGEVFKFVDINKLGKQAIIPLLIYFIKFRVILYKAFMKRILTFRDLMDIFVNYKDVNISGKVLNSRRTIQ